VRVRLLALITAAAVMASADSAVAAGTPGFFGVTSVFPPTNADLTRMGRAHVGVLREPFPWSQLEPRPGVYDLADFDRIVANAASQGITVLPFVYGTPPWARNCAGVKALTCETVSPLRSPIGSARWPAFLQTLVGRYGSRGTLWTDTRDSLSPPYRPIPIWQIWNEANSPKYFQPEPRPKAYFPLLKSAANAIHAADPQAQVMLAGLFGTPPKPGITLWRFLDKLYEMKGAKAFFDGVAVHPYSPNIKGIAFQLRRAREVMREHQDGKTPLYLTELGWGSDPPGTGGSHLYKGVAGQAQMLSRAFSFALKNRKRYKLGGVSWFAWRDLTPNETGNCILCASFGLLNNDLSTKPAFSAFVGFTGGS
jgi:hypothetical protein